MSVGRRPLPRAASPRSPGRRAARGHRRAGSARPRSRPSRRDRRAAGPRRSWSPGPNSARSIMLPAQRAGDARPAIAPTGAEQAPAAEHAPARRTAADEQRSACHQSVTPGKRKAYASRRRHHGAIATSADRCAVMGMDHAVGALTIATCLAANPCAPAEQQHVAGSEIRRGATGTRCRSAASRQRLLAARLRPVGRVGRHAFRLVADERAPDAAHEAEAIAADALQRRLMPIRRADPCRARLGAATSRLRCLRERSDESVAHAGVRLLEAARELAASGMRSPRRAAAPVIG